MEKSLKKASLFMKSRRNLIKYNLLVYFSDLELVELLKINSNIFKIIKQYFLEWKNRLKLIAIDYKLDLTSSKIDNTKFEAIKNNRAYLVKETKANYIQFLDNGIRQYGLASGESWAHYHNPSYWKPVKCSNGTFGGLTHYLNDVCWLDTQLNLYNVRNGIYDVYLRQALNNSHNMNQDSLNLKILFFPYGGQAEPLEIWRSTFINNEMANFIKDKKNNNTNHNLIELKDCLLTRIDLSKFTDEKEGRIKIEFFHIDGWWKHGWYIDGVFIDKIESK